MAKNRSVSIAVGCQRDELGWLTGLLDYCRPEYPEMTVEILPFEGIGEFEEISDRIHVLVTSDLEVLSMFGCRIPPMLLVRRRELGQTIYERPPFDFFLFADPYKDRRLIMKKLATYAREPKGVKVSNPYAIQGKSVGFSYGNWISNHNSGDENECESATAPAGSQISAP